MAENPSLTKNPNLDSWIAITRDGKVRVRMGKVDIGQKISSAVSRLAAEELDVAPGRIVMIRPDTIDGPDEGMTSAQFDGGIRQRRPPASATARAVLLAKAAVALGVEVDELDIDDGTITARSTNSATTYWELQGDQAFGVPIDIGARIKPASARKLVGKPSAPLDLEDIVTGRHVFVNDMVMDGMVHARPVRPPHALARLEAVDEGFPSGSRGRLHRGPRRQFPRHRRGRRICGDQGGQGVVQRRALDDWAETRQPRHL